VGREEDYREAAARGGMWRRGASYRLTSFSLKRESELSDESSFEFQERVGTGSVSIRDMIACPTGKGHGLW
jgi:hypothetical protein